MSTMIDTQMGASYFDSQEIISGMDLRSARFLTSALPSVILALCTGCAVSVSGGAGAPADTGAGGGSTDATVDFPSTGEGLLVTTETGVGSASFFGTRDAAGDAAVITDMSVDSGDGLFGAEFDETGRVRRAILPSGSEIGFSHNADGTFDYTLTSDGSERLSGSDVQPVDVDAFERAKTSPRLADVPFVDILACAAETTERVAESAYNLESRIQPEPDPLLDALTADAQFQDVAIPYCVLRVVVEPRLRETMASRCAGDPEVAAHSTQCIAATIALGNAHGFRISLLSVALDVATEMLRDLGNDTPTTPPGSTPETPPDGTPGTPTTQEATFTIVLHQNLDGSFGSGGAGAQVSVSGNGSFPTFNWTVPGAVELKVRRREDFERLYGITMKSPGIDPADVPPLPAPLEYGDNSIPGSSPVEGYPLIAPPLERGVEYSVDVEPAVLPGSFVPGIVFVVEPP